MLSVARVAAIFRSVITDGTDVVGVYPLLPNGTCRFIV